MPSIELQTMISASPQRCFDMCLSVEAHAASMAQFGEQVVGRTNSGQLQLGDTVTWRAKHFGVPFTMTAAITAFESPERFVDEQVAGPFRSWWHEHRFEECADGTLMVDRVTFRSPLGPVGQLVDAVFLTSYMTKLLAQRNAWLQASLAHDSRSEPRRRV